MAVIGRGAFIVSALEGSSESRSVGLIVEDSGFQIYDPLSAPHYQKLFEWLRNQPVSGLSFGAGQMSLVALPSAPKDAFYDVSFTVNQSTAELKIRHGDRFAQLFSTFFKDLDLTLVASADRAELQVSGKVHLCLFGHAKIEIQLTPQRLPEGLFFELAPNNPEFFELDSVGHLAIRKVEVGTGDDRWKDLQVLYTFDESQGEIYRDLAGARGIHPAIDLQKIDSAAAMVPVAGGLAIGNATAQPRHRSVLRSQGSVTKVLEACKTSEAITISAWVKPTRKLTKDRNDEEAPARIVSFSDGTDTRNFTLGQDCDEQNNNRYIVRLRRDSRGSQGRGGREKKQGTPPLVSKSVNVPAGELAHIVFTRGTGSSANAAGKIYINGQDCTQQEADHRVLKPEDFTNTLKGDFDDWDAAHKLLIGNETTLNRPWDGEIHQVAIYSRELTKQEIRNSYWPVIQRFEATLTLTNVPEPLNVPLPVTQVDWERAQLSVARTDFDPAAVQVEAVQLTWSPTAPLSGQVNASIWGHSLRFNVGLAANELTLTVAGDAAQTLVLRDIEPFPSLGSVQFKRLVMRADRTLNQPDWTFDTDGQVTFTAIPRPLKGPFAVQIFLDGDPRQLWFSIRPPQPLPLVEDLHFERANLRFVRDEMTGWQVTPDERQDPAGISLLLLGESRPLTPVLASAGTAKGLALTWQRPSTAAIATLGPESLGRLHLANLNLTADPTPNDEVFWRMAMSGQVPLGVSGGTAQTSVLEFSATNGQILGNPSNPQQPTRFGIDKVNAGTAYSSQIRSLEWPLFVGDWRPQGAQFLLEGRWTLFPEWSLLQVNGNAAISIQPNGQLSAADPVQVTLPDLVWQSPQLVLHQGALSLKGQWLGEPVVCSLLHRANRSIWAGDVEFKLPFSLTLGPLYDRQTGLKLADQIQVCQTLNCRQTLTADLQLELSADGFWARVNSAFPWQDAFSQAYPADASLPIPIQVPEFPLFAPPPTKNQLLGRILERVEAAADELFSPHFKPVAGYFFGVATNQLLLTYRSDRATTENASQITTYLPNLFASTATGPITEGIFTLTQVNDQCELTLNTAAVKTGAINPTQIKGQYLQFLKAVEAAASWVGAAALVRSRIAERLPAPLDHLLFYYYGFDPAERVIDLQAGMRLRVDFQNYQFVHPSDPTANSGFVGSGTNHYFLNSYLTDQGVCLGFDAFLSRLPITISRSSDGSDSSDKGAGGAIDLFQVGYRQPYFRLVYPSEVHGITGNVGRERVVTLLGASQLFEFEQTEKVRTYFRGRATVIPEIAVFVQGQPEFVPVGTTLRHVLERFAQVPSALPQSSLMPFATPPRVSRLIHEGPHNQPAYRFIHFDERTVSLGGQDIYDLPLVKGDRISL